MKKQNLPVLLLGALILRVAIPFLFHYDSPVGIFSSHPPTIHLTALPPIFSDLDPFSEYYRSIRYLKDQGIIKGNDDGTFKPESKLNRAEWAAILTRIYGVEPKEKYYKNCFPDVTNEWFAPHACFAKQQGWMTGFKAGDLAGKFGPGETLSDAEVLVTLGRLFKWETEDAEEWWQPAMNYAKDRNIYNVNALSPSTLRRDVTTDVIFRGIALESVQKDVFTPEVGDAVETKKLNDFFTFQPGKEINITTVKMIRTGVTADSDLTETFIFEGDDTGDDTWVPVCELPGSVCTLRSVILKGGGEKKLNSVLMKLTGIEGDKIKMEIDGERDTLQLYEPEVYDDFIFIPIEITPFDDLHAIKMSFPSNTNEGEHSLARVKFMDNPFVSEINLTEVVRTETVNESKCKKNYAINFKFEKSSPETGRLIDEKEYDLLENSKEVKCPDATTSSEDTTTSSEDNAPANDTDTSTDTGTDTGASTDDSIPDGASISTDDTSTDNWELLPLSDLAVEAPASTVSEVMIVTPVEEKYVDDMIRIEVLAWSADGKYIKVPENDPLTLILQTGEDGLIKIPLTYIKDGTYFAEFSSSWADWYTAYVDNGARYVDRPASVRILPGKPSKVVMEIISPQHEGYSKDSIGVGVSITDKYGNIIESEVDDYEFVVDGPGEVSQKYSYGDQNMVTVRGKDWDRIKLTASYNGVKTEVMPVDTIELDFEPVMLDFDPGMKPGEKVNIGMHVWLPSHKGMLKSYAIQMKYDSDKLTYLDYVDKSSGDGFTTTVVLDEPGLITVSGGAEYSGQNFAHLADIAAVPSPSFGEAPIVLPEITLVPDTTEIIRMPEPDGLVEGFAHWWMNIKEVKEVCLDVWITEGAATRDEVMTDVNLAADFFSFAAAECKCNFWLNFKVNFQTVITQAGWRAKVDIPGQTADQLDYEAGEYENLKNNYSAHSNCVQVWYVPDLPGNTRALSAPNNGGVIMHNAMDNADTSLGHELMHQLSGNRVEDSPDDHGNAQGARNFGNPMNYVYRGHVMTKEQCDLIKPTYPYK